MFAVTAARIDADDPLARLAVGERPDPVPGDGWVTVTMKAAALNHHDVWTLRGVGISADRLGRAAGYRVWATSRSEPKRERALKLGADQVFAVGARLPERADAVMESVGQVP
jgi:NADPH:quinone reductase-like Zn-dependent oxidoreductase